MWAEAGSLTPHLLSQVGWKKAENIPRNVDGDRVKSKKVKFGRWYLGGDVIMDSNGCCRAATVKQVPLGQQKHLRKRLA